MNRNGLRHLWILTLATGFLSGCGSKDSLVQGVVVFPDGKPLPGGRVEFESAHEKIGERINYWSNVTPDGKFSFRAKEGKYRAIVNQSRDPTPEERYPPTILHPKYNSYQSSGLEFNVSKDPKENQFKIPVTGP